MKLQFSLPRFIRLILLSNIIFYLCWAFIEMSFLIPLIKTFETSSSRAVYLAFLLCVIVMGFTYYYPYVEDKENN